jgi:hypothetical protein
MRHFRDSGDIFQPNKWFRNNWFPETKSFKYWKAEFTMTLFNTNNWSIQGYPLHIRPMKLVFSDPLSVIYIKRD